MDLTVASVARAIGLDTPPSANYDEQVGLTFTENFTSISYNVTAVQQADSYGYGPAYLLDGVTDKGYWYQVGLSFDWPYTSGGYVAGFNFNYEVFNNTGKSVFPASGGGGVKSFSGRVSNGDSVLLNLHFSSDNVAMYAYDWNTGASAKENYTAEGASLFQGLSNATANANGYFTGLMTEWWHASAYYSGEARVVYGNTAVALSSGWLWADEQVPSNRTTLFASGQYVSLSNPTQLHYFTTNSTVEAASGRLFITGGTVPLSASVSPSSTIIDVGQQQLFTSNVTGGTSPYTFQWYLDGDAVLGATGTSWIFTPSSGSSYIVYVKVTDSVGMQATSNVASVHIRAQITYLRGPYYTLCGVEYWIVGFSGAGSMRIVSNYS
jgi:hypothetical protein